MFSRRVLALVSMLLASACGSSDELPYRHVVLISLDTTRADHLGCYGYGAARTPSIDAFAKEAVLFEHAYAAAPTTLASHTSLMTGSYPHTHGVPRNGFVVDPANETLAEILRECGFATAAFVGSFALAGPFGLSQGFDTYDESFDLALGEQGVDQNQRRADKVTDAALRWLDQTKPRRSFLFVHYFDAHAPYAPPAEFDRAGRAIGLDELSHRARAQQQRFVDDPPGWEGALSKGLPRELVETADGTALAGDEQVVAQYDGEIAFVDREVGRLLEGLRARGMLDDAIVVLTADHGETFFEHGDFFNHGLWVNDTTLRVPLIVHARELAPGRVELGASSIDVMPFVLALLGLPPPRRCEGEGVYLLRAAKGESSLTRRPIFCQATQPVDPSLESGGWANVRKASCAISIDGRKLVRAPLIELEQCFDLRADPGERKDLAVHGSADDKERFDGLRAALELWNESAAPLPTRFARKQADEVRQRLKQLGYTEPEGK